ncbi:MAG: hypothetical protein HYV09_35765 [Deltaproteobacteria bacterium]|nr:hypothetical protein [Deltaproteobacteria bacterium]
MNTPLSPPAEVAELARACVEFVERATGMRLDYEPETLPILDHYVRERRAEVVAKPELVEVLAAPVGAYLGEVARRRLPLQWFAPPGEYRRWRIELENVFLSMNPIGAAVEAVDLQPAEGWGAHFRMRPDDERKAEAALANLPEVSEEDYYAPSSRLETLEIVVDAILAGTAPDDTRSYGPEDYGPFRAEAIGEALDRGAGTH